MSVDLHRTTTFPEKNVRNKFLSCCFQQQDKIIGFAIFSGIAVDCYNLKGK
jgi:hypothetical protein